MRYLIHLILFLSLTWFQGQGQDIQKATFAYAEKEGRALLLDVYQLADREKTDRRPALVWMHGGGFAGGARDNPDEVKLMKEAAGRGYVAVSISYQLTRKGKSFSCDAPRSEKMATLHTAAGDLWDAIAYVHDRAADWRINTDQLIVGGSSAGAETALIALYMRDWLYEGPHKYDTIKPLAAFTLAGALVDVRYLNAANAIPAVLFHGAKDNLVPYATAPHHYCATDAVGYLILDGSRTLANRLDALGTPYLFYIYPDARHEIARIPFDRLNEVFAFFEQLMEGKEIVQREVIVRQ